MAKAKGLHPLRIIGVHVLKNAALPLITVLGVQWCNFVAFSTITETVFAWPGLGKLLVDSILLGDRPVVVIYLMGTSLLFTTIHLLVDMGYLLLNPLLQERES